MIVHYRRLILLIIVNLVIIIIAVFIRFSNLVRPLFDIPEQKPSPVQVTKVPVPDPEFYTKNPVSTPKETEKGPEITAVAYLVGDVSTGEVYLDKNSRAVLPVASMSKLITAFAATDMYPASTTVLVTKIETEVASDTSQLMPGEKFTVGDLLYPMLLNSSNVAAEALASSTDRDKFMELMSSYAWEVGMPSSYFADPSGLSPKNISSARDFFALARYLYGFRPDILAITRVVSLKVSTTTDHGSHIFSNIHPFVRDPLFIGGKTGHTLEAGDTMLTILKIDEKPIAIVVLRSKSGNRERDTRLLLELYRQKVGLE